MVDVKVIDNVLTDGQFDRLREVVYDDNFNWFCNRGINFPSEDQDSEVYFVHMMYIAGRQTSDALPAFDPLLEKVGSSHLTGRLLIRAKINLYLRQPIVEPHGWHSDFSFHHRGCVFYFNDNNGYTMFKDGPTIESRANRAIIFDGSHPHSSTGCTDKPTRVTANFNFFTSEKNPNAVEEDEEHEA